MSEDLHERFEAAVDVAMEAAERFFPAFDFLIRCGRPPAEALSACMFETVGSA